MNHNYIYQLIMFLEIRMHIPEVIKTLFRKREIINNEGDR